jgi:hypothetical protein
MVAVLVVAAAVLVVATLVVVVAALVVAVEMMGPVVMAVVVGVLLFVAVVVVTGLSSYLPAAAQAHTRLYFFCELPRLESEPVRRQRRRTLQ